MNSKRAIELGDIVRRFGQAFIQALGRRLLPSQAKALSDIARCRSEALGGSRYRCPRCQKEFWVYHSCRNRSCPACHGRETRLWLQKREAQLLGCRYYHIVVSVPNEIRSAFLAHQKRLYSLFMKTVAESVIDLVRDERFVGATPAILMVLHTWSTDMNYHPHVHLLVSAGGVSEHGEQWVFPRHKGWLIPVKALSKLIRTRFQKRLRRLYPTLFASLPQRIWQNGWNAFCKQFGKGQKAVLDYLGRYVFRIAITNARIIDMNDTHVTFRAKNHTTATWRIVKLTGKEFLRRFVMHVLPQGFHKVRYYGLWHHSNKQLQQRARLVLEPVPMLDNVIDLLGDSANENEEQHDSFIPHCPYCGCKEVVGIALLAQTRSP